MHDIKRIVGEMKSDKLSNYIIAGLDSYLLNNGRVRLFECSRDHQDVVTPHSHRFDFVCLVLSGVVTNRVWTECGEHKAFGGDFFESSTLTYKGKVGNYAIKAEGRGFWTYTDRRYGEGETYSMTADQVHSIRFSRGAVVLFFEGPTISDNSMMIEPVVNGVKIPTHVTSYYMFLTE